MQNAAVRQARWLLWQVNGVEVEGVRTAYQTAATPAEPALQEIPHRRYDAVVQRMLQARQRTGAYSAWPAQAGSEP